MYTVYVLSLNIDGEIHFFAEAVHKLQKLSTVEANVKKVHISKGSWNNPPIKLDTIYEFREHTVFSSKKDLFEHVFNYKFSKYF